MTGTLAASCGELAALLTAAAALIAQPDADGTAGSRQPASMQPWNSAAAAAILDAHEGIRRLEASLRLQVAGHPGPRRGSSDANTMAALKAIENLGHGTNAAAITEAARILARWSRQIRELPAVDEAEPWRSIPAACPYCGHAMLRVAARSGQVTCLRYGVCMDADGRHPVGTVENGRLGPCVIWSDGLVT